MGRTKKRFNWKGRQVVQTTFVDETAFDVQVDLPEKAKTKYDDANALVLPSKKRKTKVKVLGKRSTEQKLSNKRRKKLEKILETKKKKANRVEMLEALSKVQVTPEEMSMLTSTSSMQTKGLKRHFADVKLAVQAGQDPMKINSITGSNRKKHLLPKPEAMTTESSDDSSADEQDDQCMEVDDLKSGNENKNSVEVCEVLDSPENLEKPAEISESVEVEIKMDTVERKPAIFVPVHRTPEIQKARLLLPILAEEQVIMEAINENPVVVVCGETGSGKTTQVPQFLYEAGYACGDQIIGVTEPRRVAAITMSQRVAEEMNLSCRQVSYQIRFEGNVTPETKISFMTDGVLLKEMETDFLLMRYSVIIIDEAHERSAYTDILIGFLSRVVRLREKRGKKLKLVIMSATLRIEDFTENKNLFKSTIVPVIKVNARQYPVTVHFNRRTPGENSYLQEAYKKICRIHRQLPAGGILVFVTGQQEVNTLCHKLRQTFPYQKPDESSDTIWNYRDKYKEEMAKIKTWKKQQQQRKAKIFNDLPKIDLEDYTVLPPEEEDVEIDQDEGSDIGDLRSDDEEDDLDGMSDNANTEPLQPMYVLPLYSLLPPDKQAQVFREPPENSRFCVVATNVAETSVTIPNIKYVVDTGKVKSRYYDRVTGVSTFHVTWTSKAGANQRSGRAGRTAPGHCYRIYSSAVFNDFETYSAPEICRRPIDDLVLQMKSMHIDMVINFPFPTPLDADGLRAAEQLLITLGALQRSEVRSIQDLPKADFNGKITPLGVAMSSFPVAPRFSKMLALSNQHELLPFVICLVAAFSVQEVFVGNNFGPSADEPHAEKWKEHKQRWKTLRSYWTGQGHCLSLGDASTLLGAICAAENSPCPERFCEEKFIRFKAFVEIRKLRSQLTVTTNMIIRSADLYVDPRMNPPDQRQAKLLRQILLAGLPDHIARKLTGSEIKESTDRKLMKRAYKVPELEEPVFIHSTSVLCTESPMYVVYQEIVEASNHKMYMRGVTAIEPEWIPIFAPSKCQFSKPLDDPAPSFDDKTGRVKCHMTVSFGRCTWQLPSSELDFPPGVDCNRWFAKFLLEGAVFPKLQEFVPHLLSPPTTMIKSWARLQPRTEILLKDLYGLQVDSRESMIKAWQKNRNYLLKSYLEWLPETVHSEVMKIWPPCEANATEIQCE